MDGGARFGFEDGVAFALALACFHLASTVRLFLRRRRAARDGRPLSVRQALAISAGSVLGWQATLGLVLWVLHHDGGWTAESVGVSGAAHPAAAFTLGVALFLGLTVCYRSAVRKARLAIPYTRACLRACFSLMPRHPAERVVVLFLLITLNPVTEELCFRGLLVHQLGMWSGSVWLGVAVGAVANTVNHLYQGWLLTSFHLAFFGLAVCILYSPLGLLGAIGFHFAADALPFLFIRSDLRWYVAARRAARPSTRT